MYKYLKTKEHYVHYTYYVKSRTLKKENHFIMKFQRMYAMWPVIRGPCLLKGVPFPVVHGLPREVDHEEDDGACEFPQCFCSMCPRMSGSALVGTVGPKAMVEMFIAISSGTTGPRNT